MLPSKLCKRFNVNFVKMHFFTQAEFTLVCFCFPFFFVAYIDSSETDLEPVFTALPAPSDLSNDPWLDILNTVSKQDLPSEVNLLTSSQIN